jgi:hypothetical protein
MMTMRLVGVDSVTSSMAPRRKPTAEGQGGRNGKGEPSSPERGVALGALCRSRNSPTVLVIMSAPNWNKCLRSTNRLAPNLGEGSLAALSVLRECFQRILVARYMMLFLLMRGV